MMADLPERFDDDFNLTVQHQTAVFEDLNEARDLWRSARSRMEEGHRDVDPDWSALQPAASDLANATVRALRSANPPGQ